MKKEERAVVLVYTVSQAIKIEKELAKAGIACKLIPVPRFLSSDCGVCVQIQKDDEEKVQQLLLDSNIEIQGLQPIFCVPGGRYQITKRWWSFARSRFEKIQLAPQGATKPASRFHSTVFLHPFPDDPHKGMEIIQSSPDIF